MFACGVDLAPVPLAALEGKFAERRIARNNSESLETKEIQQSNNTTYVAQSGP